MQVYKILTLEQSAEFDRTGAAPLSPDDARDGYVHLSTAPQLPGTLERHFASEQAVRILEIDPARLGGGLRWEASRGGEPFPHFYGQLAAPHSTGGWFVGRGFDGRLRLPPELRS